MRNFLGLVGLTALLAGCGGAGGESHKSLPISVATSERGTAVFDVDVETGKVIVSPLKADTNSRAVLVGSSVTFSTTTLLSDSGEVGRRALQVKLTNNLSEAIGVGRPIRIQFGVIGPALSYAYDLRSLATVSSPLRGDFFNPGYLDGPVGQAKISNPSAVAVGFDGSIYFNGTDSRVRKLQDGYVSTVAANVSTSGLVYLRDPATGSEYLVAPSSSLHSVKLIAIANGTVTTWAGLDATSGSANGTPDTARFNGPRGAAIDPSQSQVLVADSNNGMIRVITYSFSGGVPVATDVSTRFGSLSGPYAVAVSSNRSVAVVERSNHRVRVFPTGSTKPVTFGGTLGNVVGDGNVAQFSSPYGLTAVGDAFIIADGANNLIKRLALKSGAAPGVSTSWVVSLLAGIGSAGFNEGSGTAALFNNVSHLCTDNQSRIIVADSGNNSIRQINSEGSFDFGAPDGSGTGQANLTNPTGFADLNGLQRPYIEINQRVEPGQTIDIGQWQFAIPSEVKAFRFSVTVEAATSVYAPLEAVLNPTGGPGSPNVTAQYLSRGSLSSAFTGKLDSVGFDTGFLASDRNGVLYTSDPVSSVIRRIDPDGTVTLIAGKVGVSGSADGQGANARFSFPDGLSVNAAGTEIIVVDAGNATIRRIGLYYAGADPRDPFNWNVSTIAGAAGLGGYVNGTGDIARLAFPKALVGPSTDELYITESFACRVRRMRYVGGPRDVATSWEVTLAAGSATGSSGTADGVGPDARFSYLFGAAYSPDGKVYLCDSGNRLIRALDTTTSQVTTIAGSGADGSSDNVSALGATFKFPISIATDASGTIYIGDTSRIRRIYNGSVKTVAGGGDGSGTTGDKLDLTNSSPSAFLVNSQGDLLFKAKSRLVRLTRRIGR
jgi:hypothetical protein